MGAIDPVTEAGEPQPLGRRARKALATRNTMFQAGLMAFENRPLGMVSVLDITEASDVAKGVFYLHFRSKDEYLIALLEHVQRAFLDALRQSLEGTRSKRARLESVAAHYGEMPARSSRECRFWLRMASYFGDELGQPGELSRSRQDYLEQLAALIGGVTLDTVGSEEVRVAAVVDGASWGLISHATQLGITTLDPDVFVRAVVSAVGALG